VKISTIDKEIVKKKYLDILDASDIQYRLKWLNIAYILKSPIQNNVDLWHYFSSRWMVNERSQCCMDLCNTDFIYTVENQKMASKKSIIQLIIKLSKEIPNHDIGHLRPFDNILSKIDLSECIVITSNFVVIVNIQCGTFNGNTDKGE
jgi:hypothetical protein